MKQKINIERFLDNSGRIIQLPQKKNTRIAILCYLVEKFEINHKYTEKEVNAICDAWHTFGDHFIVRRELVDNGFLCRKSNGSCYWKPKNEAVALYVNEII